MVKPMNALSDRVDGIRLRSTPMSRTSQLLGAKLNPVSSPGSEGLIGAEAEIGRQIESTVPAQLSSAPCSIHRSTLSKSSGAMIPRPAEPFGIGFKQRLGSGLVLRHSMLPSLSPGLTRGTPGITSPQVEEAATLTRCE